MMWVNQYFMLILIPILDHGCVMLIHKMEKYACFHNVSKKKNVNNIEGYNLLIDFADFYYFIIRHSSFYSKELY